MYLSMESAILLDTVFTAAVLNQLYSMLLNFKMDVYPLVVKSYHLVIHYASY